jgi:hypothetical protein
MDYQGIIFETLIDSGFSIAIKEAYDGIKSIIKGHSERVKITSSQEELEANIYSEIAKTSKWAYDDLFKNHKNHSKIDSRYVHLDLLLTPRRDHVNKNQLLKKQPLKKIILANRSNTVILGQPGSGKTTSVKYIVNSILRDPDFLEGVYRIPLVIRLRELNQSNSIYNQFQWGGIFEKLVAIFGLKTEIEYRKAKKNKDSDEWVIDSKYKEKDDKKLGILIATRLIPYLLDSQKILLILDGFDEIADDSVKKLVVSEIKVLRESLNEVNFILTSRSADYKIKLEQTDVYEISDLNDKQIKEFADKWFENKSLSKKFIKEISEKKHCADFCKRPLLLTQLAQIYSRTDEIPDKPKMIYQRIIEISLKEWNEQQGIKRRSKYSHFTVERKKEFLSNMAFALTTKYHKQEFSNRELASIYRDINHKFKELPMEEVESVVEEIETHNGLIIKSRFDCFEFSHLTIQEYFVADYIIRTGNIKRLDYSELIRMPNELAISVALSSEPDIYLRDLLVNILFKDDVDDDFAISFFNRLNIEKPDFEVSIIVNIVLLELFTGVCNTIQSILDTEMSNRDQSMLNNSIEKRNKLEILINKVCHGNVIGGLNEYYDMDYMYLGLSIDLGLIDTYRLKQNIDHVSLPVHLYWPKER